MIMGMLILLSHYYRYYQSCILPITVLLTANKRSSFIVKCFHNKYASWNKILFHKQLFKSTFFQGFCSYKWNPIKSNLPHSLNIYSKYEQGLLFVDISPPGHCLVFVYLMYLLLSGKVTLTSQRVTGAHARSGSCDDYRLLGSRCIL